MALKLKPGTELVFAIRQDPETKAYVLEQRLRVGSDERPRGKPVRFSSEEGLWTRMAEVADDHLARVGLEKTKR